MSTVTPGLQHSEDMRKAQVEALRVLLEERVNSYKERLARKRKAFETRLELERKARVTREEELNERIRELSKKYQQIQYALEDETNGHNSTKSVVRVADAQRNAADIRVLDFERTCRTTYSTAIARQVEEVRDLRARATELGTRPFALESLTRYLGGYVGGLQTI
jgi:HrpA-like RNA helicase